MIVLPPFSGMIGPAGAGGGGGTPSDFANIWMWGEPSRETGLSNTDPMPTLTDQTGNGRHFTQPTSAFRPIYTTNVLNGLAVSDHAGSSSPQFWGGPDTTTLTEGHIFLVVKRDVDTPGSASDSGLWRMSTADASNHYPWTDGAIYDGTFTAARKTVGNPTPSLADWRVVEVSSKSAEWIFRLDGTVLHSTATNTFQGRASTLLGSNQNDFLPGQIAGLYIFSAVLASRTDIITYINDRFALSSS